MLNKLKKLMGIEPLIICKSEHGDSYKHCHHFEGTTTVAHGHCVAVKTELSVYKCCRCADEYAKKRTREYYY